MHVHDYLLGDIMNKVTLAFLTYPFLSLTALSKPMTATLMLKEKVSVHNLAVQVFDENSDHFGSYYTPEEIKELSAPEDEDYSNLIRTLKELGFKISFESKTHLVLSIKGDSSLFEKTFRTRIEFKNEFLHTNLSEAVIPEKLSLIESVIGLDNRHAFKPMHKKIIAAENLGDQPGILPQDIKRAYKLDPIYNMGITGKDQHIAIATYMDFVLSDVTQYYNLINLSPLPKVDKVNFNGRPSYDADSASETALDAEMSGMIAPGSRIHVFTSAENSQSGELALFTAILDDNRSKIVNYSWGLCETYTSANQRFNMDKVFARAVAQGVNIFVASGDSGSDSCDDGTNAADWPAIHPNVVAVGGTSVYLSTTGTKSERGWSGSGGGLSAHYSLPRWQSDFRSPFIRRSFPDVSFNADPATGQGIWVRSSLNGSPSWVQVGGTSMSAPQWAGILALVNEGRKLKGMENLGFLNPILYKASAYDKSQIFLDITTGKNGLYRAATGWDAVTGWGVPKGINMYDFLMTK